MDSPVTPKRALKRFADDVDLYAVQCEECFKWRLLSTQEEFEDVRSRLKEEPFRCSRKLGSSCKDPADIEYDSSRTWVIDKPNIPKTPQGFKRRLVLRKNYSKMDAYYTTPTGKSVRSISEMAVFLEKNPKYRHIPLSSFNFAVPKIMEDTIPENVLRSTASSSGVKKTKTKSSATSKVKHETY